MWWRFGPDWRTRQPILLRHLRAADADVIALQECWGTEETTQAHEFAAELGMHAGFVAPGLPPAPDPPETEDQAGVQVGIGVLSRWPLTSVRAVALPARHRTPAPVAAVAEVAHPAGPLHVVAACLGWELAYTDDRIAQAEAVVDLVTDPANDGPLPVVLCGDLNAAPDSPVLRPLHDALVDTWTAGGGHPAATTLRSDHPQAPMEATELIDQRIDHIFIRPGQPRLHVAVESVAVLGDPVDGTHPSDHQAVVSDLTWTAESNRSLSRQAIRQWCRSACSGATSPRALSSRIAGCNAWPSASLAGLYEVRLTLLIGQRRAMDLIASSRVPSGGPSSAANSLARPSLRLMTSRSMWTWTLSVRLASASSIASNRPSRLSSSGSVPVEMSGLLVVEACARRCCVLCREVAIGMSPAWPMWRPSTTSRLVDRAEAVGFSSAARVCGMLAAIAPPLDAPDCRRKKRPVRPTPQAVFLEATAPYVDR